jgi:hypothetical protein
LQAIREIAEQARQDTSNRCSLNQRFIDIRGDFTLASGG